jgi:hypothetical protein
MTQEKVQASMTSVERSVSGSIRLVLVGLQVVILEQGGEQGQTPANGMGKRIPLICSQALVKQW